MSVSTLGSTRDVTKGFRGGCADAVAPGGLLSVGRSAFTLVELLIVIGIIVILIALLLPTIGAIRARSRSAQCANNQRQVWLAYKVALENRPAGVDASNWKVDVLPFVSGDEENIFYCPDDVDRKEASSFGMNHRASRLGPKDSQGIVFLDYKDVTARIVGRSMEQLNAEWPAQYAARHVGQVNLVFHDGSGDSRYPDDVDPRYCEYYRKYWWPDRDTGMELDDCREVPSSSTGPGAGTGGSGSGSGAGGSGGSGTEDATGGAGGSGASGGTDGGSDGGSDGGGADSGSGGDNGTSDPPTSCDSHLMAHWSFDDPNDPGLDSSGNGHNGALNGAQWQDDPQRGGVIYFDGAGDWMDVPHHNDLMPSDNMTIAYWCQFAGSLQQKTVIAKRDDLNDSGLVFETLDDTGVHGLHWINLVGGGARNAGWDVVQATYPIGNWIHIAVTYDGTNFRCYANGSFVHSDNNLKNIGPIIPNTVDVRLGANNWNWLLRELHGSLDDFRIYDCILSDSDIAALAGQ